MKYSSIAVSLKYTPHFVSASPNYTSWEFSASCTLQTNRTADQFSSAAAVNSLCKPHCASIYQIQIRRNEEEAVLMEAGSARKATPFKKHTTEFSVLLKQMMVKLQRWISSSSSFQQLAQLYKQTSLTRVIWALLCSHTCLPCFYCTFFIFHMEVPRKNSRYFPVFLVFSLLVSRHLDWNKHFSSDVKVILTPQAFVLAQRHSFALALQR